MANSPVSQDRHTWTGRVAAGAIAASAAVICTLCVANGDAENGIGVLLVHGMALAAVLASRSGASVAPPVRRDEGRRVGAMHLRCVSAQG